MKELSMADDNTLTIAVQADTSNFRAGIDEVNAALGFTRIAANNTKNPVAELFGTLQSSSDKAVAGILKGTESWQKAMLNIVEDLEIKFVQLNVNKLINWVETETGMTQATLAGNAARAASDASASDSSVAAQAEKAVSSILNDAKQVFGGIFAFLAPDLGPAAAGPAAAGSATVAALASGITFAESGAWEIPGDTYAYLHAGEMVVPQSFASSLRENGGGLGGGGDSYTININAIDTQTGAQFLKNNASVIASTLSTQARNFNRNIPTWKS